MKYTAPPGPRPRWLRRSRARGRSVVGGLGHGFLVGEAADLGGERRRSNVVEQAWVGEWAQIVERLMMILVGMMVGVIVIAMYLSMFKMLSLVK